MSELVLHILPGRPWGTPNLSPFCTKLETYLRMSGEAHSVAPANMRLAPKGKVPYVNIDGQLVGDSQLVIDELERRRGAAALDAGLTPAQRALGHVARRTLDEAFYFVSVFFRWHEDAGYRHVVPEFKRLLPGPLALLLPVIRRGVRRTLKGQGTGRHSAAEVAAMGQADIDALAALLGDQPFLLGDQPHVVDASLFAFLEGILGFPADTPIKQRAAAHANLVAYRQRVRDRWWQDLAKA